MSAGGASVSGQWSEVSLNFNFEVGMSLLGTCVSFFLALLIVRWLTCGDLGSPLVLAVSTS